jgi:hypothetical protein
MFSAFQKACNLPSGFHTKSLHIFFSYSPTYLAALLMLSASLCLSLSLPFSCKQPVCLLAIQSAVVTTRSSSPSLRLKTFPFRNTFFVCVLHDPHKEQQIFLI